MADTDLAKALGVASIAVDDTYRDMREQVLDDEGGENPFLRQRGLNMRQMSLTR